QRFAYRDSGGIRRLLLTGEHPGSRADNRNCGDQKKLSLSLHHGADCLNAQKQERQLFLDSYERIKDSEGILGAWLCLPRGGAGSFLLLLQRCSCASGWPLPECARYRRAKGVRRSLAEFQLPTGQPYE